MKEYIENPRVVNNLSRDSMIKGILKNPDEILYEDEYSWIIINTYPVTPGNIMVIPKRSVNYLTELSAEESKSLMDLIEISAEILEKVYQLPCMTLKYHSILTTQDHLHFHVIPTDMKYRDLYFEAKDLYIKKIDENEAEILKINVAAKIKEKIAQIEKNT